MPDETPRQVVKTVVELGDSSNRNFVLQSLKAKIRGRWVTANANSSGSAMATMPDIPGQRLEINFQERKLRIFDPLTEDAAKMDQVNHVVNKASVAKGRQLGPVPEQNTTLHADTLKTLLLELLRFQEEDKLIVVSGRFPNAQQIEKMPGDELFDPGNSSRFIPRYKRDYDDFAAKVNHLT